VGSACNGYLKNARKLVEQFPYNNEL